MKFTKIACLGLLPVALSLGACSNMDIRPASQAPRTYIAAHDTIDGECRNETRQTNTQLSRNHNDGRFTFEDALPGHHDLVRCKTEHSTDK